MNLIERAQAIVLRPRETWPVIERESATVGSIYSQWLVYMAAIPAVAGFVGLSLIGMGGFGFSLHQSIGVGLAQMITSYLLSLVMAFLVALVVDALAPNFGGHRDRIAALKLVAYGSTAAYLGGVFALVPILGMLSLLAACYSIYLFYLGLPVMMKCPQDKALPYTAVVVVCVLVVGAVLGAVRTLSVTGPSPWVIGGGV